MPISYNAVKTGTGWAVLKFDNATVIATGLDEATSQNIVRELNPTPVIAPAPTNNTTTQPIKRRGRPKGSSNKTVGTKKANGRKKASRKTAATGRKKATSAELRRKHVAKSLEAGKVPTPEEIAS